MQPFKIKIAQSVLTDLNTRITNTRWTDEIKDSGWGYGTNLTYLKDLCTYWANEFDWEKQQEYLNSFSHYKTSVDSFGLHFIHHKGEGKNPVPLLLSHGWPDSFVRFLKIIPLLTKEDENGLCFDVVIPSIPGYGFSDIPHEKGMNKQRIAELFTKLMTENLGYTKFIAQGGDWGAGITENIGLYHGESVYGIHLTDIPFEHSMEEPKDASSEEKKYIKQQKEWQMTEGAYSIQQGTKPQTLAYGLNDSPVGLAGWIIEKFKSWSDNDGRIETVFTKDELLTNLTIYWATQTINSAIRIYYESMKTITNAKYNPLVKLNPFDKTGDRSEVPAAFAIFPKDIAHPPKDLADRYFNVVQWNEFSDGGHFAAMEQPELLAEDIRKFTTLLKAGN